MGSVISEEGIELDLFCIQTDCKLFRIENSRHSKLVVIVYLIFGFSILKKYCWNLNEDIEITICQLIL